METDLAPTPDVSPATTVVGEGPVATVFEVDGAAVKVFEDGFAPGSVAPVHRAIHAETGRGTLDAPDGREAAYIRSPLARRSLDALVREQSKRSWHETTILGVHLAGALQTAHDAGLVHGAVKPTNVLVTDSGDDATESAVLTDFDHGSWRVAESDRGVLGYVAPEVLDGAAPTAAADVYGLGATLVFALSGKAPFTPADGETLMRTLRRVMSEPVDDVRPLRVPDDVASVVERAMAKDPEQRYASAAQLGEALRDAQRAHGHKVTVLEIGAPDSAAAAGEGSDLTSPELGDTPPPVRRSPTLRRWVLGGVAALVLIAVVATVVLAATSRPPRAGDSVAATAAPPTAASTPPTTAAPATGADASAGADLPKGADDSVFVDVPGYFLTDEAADSVVSDPALAASILQKANVALVRTEDGHDVGVFVVLVLQEQVADDPDTLTKIVDAVAPDPPEAPESTEIGGQPMMVTTTPDGLTLIAAQDPSGLIVGLLRGSDRGLMEQFLTALGEAAQ